MPLCEKRFCTGKLVSLIGIFAMLALKCQYLHNQLKATGAHMGITIHIYWSQAVKIAARLDEAKERKIFSTEGVNLH